jgi:hypothetical protein
MNDYQKAQLKFECFKICTGWGRYHKDEHGKDTWIPHSMRDTMKYAQELYEWLTKP